MNLNQLILLIVLVFLPTSLQALDYARFIS